MEDAGDPAPVVEDCDPGLDCVPWEDACPPSDGRPCAPPLGLFEPLGLLEPLGLPGVLGLLELVEPLLPPLVFCGGNGDSLPLLPWLVLGLPPDVEGDDEGGDALGGCGRDGVCVAVVVEQPVSASAQMTGPARAWM